MKRRNFKIGITLISGLLIIAPFSAILVSCSSIDQNRLVYGNFESYMSNDVERYLQTKYDVSFDSYETNEQILSILKNDSMDVVTPSTYMDISLIKDNLIQPLDWSKFKLGNIKNVNDLIKNNIFTPATIKAMDAYGDLNGDGIIVPYDSLFDSNNKLILSKSYKIFKNGVPSSVQYLTSKNNGMPGALDLFSQDSLLNWTIPYFLQDNIFAYRGPEINSWGPKKKSDADKTTNWSDVLYTMSHDKRFYHAKTPNLGMVDDSRTIYSIPRLMQDGNANVNPQLNKKPGEFQNVEISDVEKTYKYFVNEFKNSSSHILLNSDSSVILNKLSRDEISGGIMYNGDVVYSVTGGDDGINIKANDIHFKRPNSTLVALDTIAFNKNLKGDKLDAAYNIVRTIMFDTIDKGGVINDAGSLDNNKDYKYWSTKNFDEVNYTPVVTNMYNFATSQGHYDPSSLAPYDSYFGNSKKDLMEKELLKIDVNQKMLEQPLNNISKSNMQIAYYSFKNDL